MYIVMESMPITTKNASPFFKLPNVNYKVKQCEKEQAQPTNKKDK
jgi:hypothetical protein